MQVCYIFYLCCCECLWPRIGRKHALVAASRRTRAVIVALHHSQLIKAISRGIYIDANSFATPLATTTTTITTTTTTRQVGNRIIVDFYRNIGQSRVSMDPWTPSADPSVNHIAPLTSPPPQLPHCSPELTTTPISGHYFPPLSHHPGAVHREFQQRHCRRLQ